MHEGLVGMSERQETIWNSKRRWEVDVKVNVKERGRVAVNWINPAQDRSRWRGDLNTAMNRRVPLSAGNLFSSRGALSSPGRTLLQGICVYCYRLV